MAKHAHNTHTEEAEANTIAAAHIAEAVSIEIAGLQVSLPVKFSAGHVLTAHEADALDAAYRRQFANNQNALAKSREKAGKAALTAAELADLYATYAPNVGARSDGIGAMEKLRREGAWRAYLTLVHDHNRAVKAGEEPVIAGAKAGQLVAVPQVPRKARGSSEEAHKVAVEQFATVKAAIVARMLDLPRYADRVQREIDALMAEKGKAEAVAESVDVVSIDML